MSMWSRILKKKEDAGAPDDGWFAGMQYNFSPKVFITSTYGQSRLYSMMVILLLLPTSTATDNT